MVDRLIGKKILVRGIVQGVGFRPFVYAQALANHLFGWVRNTSKGVEIEISGTRKDIEAFLNGFKFNLPPLARIDTFKTQTIPVGHYSSFDIISSLSQPEDFLPISPDMSICPDCQEELFNPNNRRYRYPFINCTNCGPRFTIIQGIPYDRPLTTMAGFPMCENCLEEYQDPFDRRFHAQPIACPVCGPQLYFETGINNGVMGETALSTVRELLKAGKILAIKGLGGFHLACDASNREAVQELRNRKNRIAKAFALMAFDLISIERHANLTIEERQLLQSSERPVVLLERVKNSLLPYDVAPGQNTLGFMLPYTPLHLLLLEPKEGYPEILVMTSGNLSEEPIVYRDIEARSRIGHLVDGILFHNRPIHMRVDDSVTRIVNSKPYILRRARGYAPNPIIIPKEIPQSLATGAELKNVFCFTRENYAFMSHHIGDLDNYETMQSFEEGINHFQHLFRINPEFIACDMHPDYLTSRYANNKALEDSLPLFRVQHHHAHLAACLADNGWKSDQPVIGLTFDGTGFGTDKAIWGGEFLLGNYSGYKRKYHLAYVPLPGGDVSVKKPARMALAHLKASGIVWEEDLAPVRALSEDERKVIFTQIEHHVNSPLTSSMGRLFDAAASIMGIRQVVSYEGQAAIEMENLIDTEEKGFYQFEITKDIIDPTPLWMLLMKDWHLGVPPSKLSSRFHNSIVELSKNLCQKIRSETQCNTVALTGGVWQNKYLLEHTYQKLKNDEFQVLFHRQLPPNDGSIAIGQALIAADSFR
jgi:hydrogenase maturation protein HypF